MINKFKNGLSEDYFTNKYFFVFLIIPITLIPAFLISGPFLPDLVVTICAITMLIYIIVKKKTEYLKFKSFYFFIFFCIYILISSFFAKDVYLSLSETLFYIRFAFFSLFIYFILKKFKNFIFYFTIIFICTFLILFIDAYYQYFFTYNIIGNYYNGYRLNSFFGQELKLGSYVVRLLPLLIGLIFYNFKNVKLQFLIISFIIINSIIIVTLSGERIAFFLLLFFLVSFLALVNFKKIYKFLIFITLPFLFSLILIFDDTTRVRMFDSTVSLFLNDKQIEYYFISRSHHNAFSTAYNIFIENPIFGVGVKNFRVLCNEEKYYLDEGENVIVQENGMLFRNEYGCFTHPHNNYMQILTETGIIGFSFIFILFFFLFKTLFRHFVFQFLNKKKHLLLKNHQICIYLSLIMTLLPFIPSGNFFNNWLSVIYFLPIGFVFYFNNKISK